jgi:CRP-like cAMP-binding protein
MTKPIDVTAHFSKIRRIDAFRYLREEELHALLALSDIVEFATGDRIIQQGDISEYFFAVIDGCVNVTVQELKEDDVEVNTIQPGDVFGESAIFLREERSANVVACDPTIALRIHRKSIMSFIKANPSAGNKFLMVIILSLLAKLKNANQEIAFEKQSEIDFDYVDSLVEDFMKEI